MYSKRVGLRDAFGFFQMLVWHRRLDFDVFQRYRASSRCILMFFRRRIAFLYRIVVFFSFASSRSA